MGTQIEFTTALAVCDHIREASRLHRYEGYDAAVSYIEAVQDAGVRHIVREASMAFGNGQLAALDRWDASVGKLGKAVGHGQMVTQ